MALHTQGHISCPNYNKGHRPVIEYKHLDKGRFWNTMPIEPKIVLIISGSIEISTSDGVTERLDKGKVFLLLSNMEISISPLENTDVTIFRLRIEGNLRELFSFKYLIQADYPTKGDQIKQTKNGFSNNELTNMVHV